MKEPSVIVKMLIAEADANTTSGANIAAGVVIADCGTTEPKMFYSSTEVLKEFTLTGKITRSTDTTVIHASAIADLMPVYLKRSIQDNGARAGVAFKKDNSNTGNTLFFKGEQILAQSVPVTIKKAMTLEAFDIQVGTTIYYAGSVPGTPGEGNTTQECTEITEVGTALESIFNYINKIDPLHYLQIISEQEDGTATAKMWCLATEKKPTNEYTSTYADSNWDSATTINDKDVLMYVYSRYPGQVNYVATLEANPNNKDLIGLTVETPIKTYEYEGSLDPDYINEYGANQAIENINEYTIPFTVVMGGAGTDTSSLTSHVTQSFGNMIAYSGTGMADRREALNVLAGNDDVKVAFWCPFGYPNTGYIDSLVTIAQELYGFVPCGIMAKTDDAEAIKALAPTTKSSYIFTMAPFEKNTGIADYVIDLSLEVAYLKTIVQNAAAGKEWAPVMGKANGILSISKPSVILTKTTRESLLDSNIMSVITRTSESLNYLNKNKCLGGTGVMSEEQNVRLACRINRDMDVLLEQFIGRYNTQETRTRVVALINNYFANNITNQIYSIDSFNVICDETNNPADIRANNQLVVDISVRYLNAIYEVIVYHRALDVSSAG